MSDEELTKELNICRMSQVVMDNTIADLEAKLATCEKYRDAYAECDRIGTQAVRDLEAKLAKAVEAMRETLDAIEGYNQTLPDEDGLYWDGANAGLIAQEIVSARTTLAEIKGENHDRSTTEK